jgi:GNAT superfamily N-acetyltransferase
MFLIAVHPDMQSVGVNAAVIEHIMKNAWEHGIEYAETGPQLETNAKILSQWNIFDKEQHKRRRCFIKELYPPLRPKAGRPCLPAFVIAFLVRFSLQ